MRQLMYPPSEELSETSLRDLWDGLRRHRWLIAGMTVLCIALAGVVLALSTPLYRGIFAPPRGSDGSAGICMSRPWSSSCGTP